MNGEKNKTRVIIGQIVSIILVTLLWIGGGLSLNFFNSLILDGGSAIGLFIIWYLVMTYLTKAIFGIFGEHKPTQLRKEENIAKPIPKITPKELTSIQGSESILLALFLFTVFGGLMIFPILMSMELSSNFMYAVSILWFVFSIGLMISLIVVSDNNTTDTKSQIESINTYSKGTLYVRAKNKLIAEREKLETLLRQDINTLGSTSSSNYEIYHTIELFSKNIIDTTDSLIAALPEDTSIMSEFDDRDEFYRYLDYLLYEMSWIKETSATMQKEIQTWMVYHHIEVQQEKAKMEQILREENTKLSDSMSTLLATSSALRESSDNSQIEDILVRQRI